MYICILIDMIGGRRRRKGSAGSDEESVYEYVSLTFTIISRLLWFKIIYLK